MKDGNSMNRSNVARKTSREQIVTEFEVVDDDELRDAVIAKSDEYYRKGIATTRPYRTYPPSELLDFGGHPILEAKIPLSEPPMWCINNPNRLTDLIREKERHVCYLAEGLIQTANTDVLQKMFKKVCVKHAPKELCDLKIADFNVNEIDKLQVGGEKVIDYAFRNEPDMDISPLVRFLFAIYSSGNSKNDDAEAARISGEITDELYFCGYNFSSVHRVPSRGSKHGGKDVLLYTIQFEAKYSDFNFQMAPVFYHVTLKRYIDKITSRGLVPSSKSSLFHYPDRVYLFNFHHNESSTERQKCMTSYMRQRLMSIFNFEKDVSSKFDPEIDKSFYIIKIKRDKLLQSQLYKAGKLEFYIDACYDGEIRRTDDSPAMFTYNTIPPSLIESDAMCCPIISASKQLIEFGDMKNISLR